MAHARSEVGVSRGAHAGSGCTLQSVQASLTTNLNLALAGDNAAAERAWTEVYGEVRAIAAEAIARETGANSVIADLHPTGLVNEIFLRIGRHPPRAWDSRGHFFGAVADLAWDESGTLWLACEDGSLRVIDAPTAPPPR